MAAPRRVWTRDRLVRLGCMWLAASAIALALHLWGQTEHGRADRVGHPFGDDALNFWAAPRLALGGRATVAYDVPAFHAFEQAAIGGAILPYHYSYPPVAMLLTAPLALLPFLPFWAAWLAPGWLLYALCVRHWLREHWLLYAAATPAVLVDLMSGQIGCWVAAIFGFGLWLLPTRPVAAGLVLSLALVKPQLVLLVPLAFLGARYWRALAGFAAGAASLLAGTVWAFGAAPWPAYWRQATLLRTAILEDGTGVWHRFVSVFVLLRHAGAPVDVAYAVQGVVTLAMAGLVIGVWHASRGDADGWRRNTVLVIASVLASPYVSDYDLVLAAFVPLWRPEGTKAGAAAALAFVAPVVAAPLAVGTGLAAGGLLLVPALWLAVTRRSAAPA